MSSKAHLEILPRPLHERYLVFLNAEILNTLTLYHATRSELFWVHHNKLKELKEIIRNGR